MSILTDADKIINGQREKDYGTPKENFERIARIWSILLGVDITPSQVALCMVGVKIARLANDIEHEDSWKDVAGYVGCWERLHDAT